VSKNKKIIFLKFIINNNKINNPMNFNPNILFNKKVNHPENHLICSKTLLLKNSKNDKIFKIINPLSIKETKL
jgi:hypothetical protein